MACTSEGLKFHVSTIISFHIFQNASFFWHLRTVQQQALMQPCFLADGIKGQTMLYGAGNVIPCV